jgi:imidazolonepropionase-like amidohydrolase
MLQPIHSPFWRRCIAIPTPGANLRAAPHCAAVTLVFLLSFYGPVAADPARTWIVGATVISPEQQDIGHRLNVLVEGDRIAAVTDALPGDAAQSAIIVHAEGRFLIPGLIDSHVHLSSIPGLTFGQQPELAAAYLKQVPRSYLRYGYTTVIDVNVTDRRALEDMRAAPEHPDIYDCGGGLPVPDGYPSSFAPPAYRSIAYPNTLFDRAHPEAFPDSLDRAEHSPRAAVARVRSQGGICIKTYFERGFGRDRNLPVPSLPLIQDVVLAASATGLPVLLHANSFEAQTFGIDAGVSIFAHGMWNWGVFNNAETLPPQIRALLDRIVDGSIGYQSTLQVIGGLQLLFDPAYLDRPDVRRVIPGPLLAWYRSADAQWYKRDLAQGESGERMRDAYERGSLRRGNLTVKYLADRGARFLFGTDTPSGPTVGNLPGLNGYLEMRRLAAAGVSLRQIFEAATLSNAKAFLLEDKIGTIAVGKRANLVLLSHSPLQSVEAYDKIQAVWIAGRRLDPTNLEAP